MISIKQTVAAAFLACVGAPVAADTVADFIFDETVLSDLKDGATLVYTHDLTAPETAPQQAFEGGAINVVYAAETDQVGGSGEVVISYDRGRVMQNTQPMPTAGGNPLVMVFLESSARAMAGIAGGSPFYIRNRIKNALLTEGVETMMEVEIDGKAQMVRRVTLMPFSQDQNKARMGPFSQLEMSFTYSADVPGGIHELRTFVPLDKVGAPLYEERIVFSTLEEPQ